VVVGTDPFGRVDGALLERRVDVAARDELRHDAQLLHDLAGHAADAHLDALEILDALDLLAEPAAHLRARVAARHLIDVVALVELAEELEAAAEELPCVRLARVEAERDRAVERERRILAPEI